MFSASGQSAAKKAAFIANAQKAREEREASRKEAGEDLLKENASKSIQKFWRKILNKRVTKDKLRHYWDTAMAIRYPATPAEILVQNLQLGFVFRAFYDPLTRKDDEARLALLCKVVLAKTIDITHPLQQKQEQQQQETTTDSAARSTSSTTKKPTPQIPLFMSLLHARFSQQATKLIKALLNWCTSAISGYRLPIPSPVNPEVSTLVSPKLATYSKIKSPAATKKESSLPRELYKSGPELRFLLAYLDLKTYTLPQSANATIREQLVSRGRTVVLSVLDSGQFFKDIRAGLTIRSMLVLTLQQRKVGKQQLSAMEKETETGLKLWMSAVWRCLLLMGNVDEDSQPSNVASTTTAAATGKGAITKPSVKERGNLIDLHSNDSPLVGIVSSILTIPLLLECLDETCHQVAKQERIFTRAVATFLDDKYTLFIHNSLKLDDRLFLLGNLCSLYRLEAAAATALSSESSSPTALKQQPQPQQQSSPKVQYETELVEIAVILLNSCQQYVSESQTAQFRHFHPLFSWTSISSTGQQLSAAQFKLVVDQFALLWSRAFALRVFDSLLKLEIGSSSSSPPPSPQSTVRSFSSTSIGKAASSISNNTKSSSNNKNSDPQRTLMAMDVQRSCYFYLTLMKTLPVHKTKILVTLMYLPHNFLATLWRFMMTLGPHGKMQIYLEAATRSMVPVSAPSTFNLSNQATIPVRNQLVSSSQTVGSLWALDKEPLMDILQIYCECCSRFLVTLDDDDMYKQQKPWQLSELVAMAGFLNQFCFAILSQRIQMPENVDKKQPPTQQLEQPQVLALPTIFYPARQVLMQLYERDCRQAFCPADHWLLLHPTKSIFRSPLQLLASLSLSTNNSNSTGKSDNSNSSIKSGYKPPSYSTPKEFITKIQQRDPTALGILETMPHTIPFSARLEIFRDFIKSDKMMIGAQHVSMARQDLNQSILVKVRRGYVLEDGFAKLGQVPSSRWKNPIRVKFVNESGADEAGIDQGGPFKEFMESFLSSAFSPDLNLFTATVEGGGVSNNGLLYPSPTSIYTHPGNFRDLYRLFGKMMGKAMYEGLLIDANFAGFFLCKLLGRTVFLDEMKSYDEEVYRNLIFLKKYEGDVEDLGLRFALDEQVFGTVKTIELLPGGDKIEVTKENRISYLFQVADYRLNRQIQEQTKAFVEGFRAVIPLNWINTFSPQELHRVLAGDDVDYDVQDLRNHTEYQNGYFDQHPVIRNLWHIVSEMPSEEKKAFLKFVTSGSKPPLGGFKHLYPPFTIRMVLAPTTSDESGNSNTNGARQYGSGAAAQVSPTTNTTNTTMASAGSPGNRSGGVGSRMRSAFGSFSSSSSSSSSSQQSSSLASSSSSRTPSAISSAFATTIDEHGTPAAFGIVKSFFGAATGGGLSSKNGEMGKKARLPTSSTCFNLLKLPPFNSKSVLKEKLRYAITSNTGFELS